MQNVVLWHLHSYNLELTSKELPLISSNCPEVPEHQREIPYLELRLQTNQSTQHET